MLCRNCCERNTKFLLPVLPPIPEALQQLQPIEQHLIAMARISQVLLDKLPAGGPSAQWGRMYAVLVDDPFICDVLEGATLEEDGTVLVEGVQGQMASPARLDCLHKALWELKAQHRLYKANPAVDEALARMEAILAGKRPSSGSVVAHANNVTSQGRQTEEFGGSHSSALGGSARTPDEETEAPEQEGTLEMTYLIPKELKVPRAQKTDLQKARSVAALSDDMDVKFFPHLFPAGTGGWQNGYGSISQYARKRLLGLDPRFEASPAYIMWLLEMHIKKRLSGNINVRIGGQPPNGKSQYQEGRGQVFTALRDIPGTSSYVFAKKGVALNMYEQLGTPKFFMTLSCHARQPDILIAVIMARLLRLRPESQPEELEREAAQILQCYQADKKFTWDGLSPNQLCNQYPAIVARQFMHQLTQLMHWLSAEHGASSHMDEGADAQDEPEGALEQDFIQAPAADSAGQHRGVRKEDPPFRVVDYLIRIEWQKRGYPHAHILLWVVEWESKTRKKPDDKMKVAPEGEETEAEAQVPDWSDDEAMKQFVPTCAEEWSDKYITTKGPLSWRRSTKVSARDKELNAQLAELLVHKHTEYCGIKTRGACRFGFPHHPEPRTRRRSSQEKYANSRWKSSLATRRAECDKGMGQYNIKILRRWRASMDLQVICELTSASRYILGYALKSEQDQEAQRRVESIVARLTSSSVADASLSNQQIYKAAHAALQGRTTSTFEACHLLLGFPVVQFSRDNEWIQVGPPETWTLSVPKYDESAALQRPDSYRRSKVDRDGHMPVAQRWYREMQKAFSEQEVDIPVEGGKSTACRFRELNFLDFCAAFKFIGVEFPQPRKRPAIVAYRNFSPDQEPEAFYYSRLMLYTVWKDPGDWLREEDGGSHAAAFRRLARDLDGNPDFLRSRCFPQMDGTVNAARKLQAVQATMYMRARIHQGHSVDGWASSKVAQDNYEDSLKILEALKRRHGDDIEFEAPEHVPTGAAGDAFAPVEEGEESFDLLTVENPSPETQHQRRAMEYIIQSALKPSSKDATEPERLHMLLHGPGGCGKSVVVRASAHMLRQSGIGVIIAAPTGVAAWNINGVTLHSCCLLPVVNKSYGKACDLPLPSGPQLAALQNIWKLVSVLFVDEMSFVSSYMLERLDQHLRLAKNMAYIPFGGVHLVLSGDLYQLPPPGGLPPFASHLWMLFQLCELAGNQSPRRQGSEMGSPASAHSRWEAHRARREGATIHGGQAERCQAASGQGSVPLSHAPRGRREQLQLHGGAHQENWRSSLRVSLTGHQHQDRCAAARRSGLGRSGEHGWLGGFAEDCSRRESHAQAQHRRAGRSGERSLRLRGAYRCRRGDQRGGLHLDRLREECGGQVVRGERRQLRRDLAPVGQLSGHGRQQGVEAPIPVGDCESHLHSQEPGGHPARRRPLPLGCHLHSRGSSLCGPEPLPGASPLHFGALQPQSIALQRQRRMGANQAQSSAGRPRWFAALEAALPTPQEQELLREQAQQHAQSRLAAAAGRKETRTGGSTLAVPGLRPGDTENGSSQEAAPAHVSCQTRAQSKGQKPEPRT